MTRKQRAEYKLENVLRFAAINHVIRQNPITGKYSLADNQTGRGLRPRLARAFARCQRHSSAEPIAPVNHTPVVLAPAEAHELARAHMRLGPTPGRSVIIVADGGHDVNFAPAVVARLRSKLRSAIVARLGL